MTHIDGLLLVDAEALHETQRLFVELPDRLGDLGDWADRLAGCRNAAVRKPLVGLDLVNGQPLGRVDDQHVPDQILTFCEGKRTKNKV